MQTTTATATATTKLFDQFATKFVFSWWATIILFYSFYRKQTRCHVMHMVSDVTTGNTLPFSPHCGGDIDKNDTLNFALSFGTFLCGLMLISLFLRPMELTLALSGIASSICVSFFLFIFVYSKHKTLDQQFIRNTLLEKCT